MTPRPAIRAEHTIEVLKASLTEELNGTASKSLKLEAAELEGFTRRIVFGNILTRTNSSSRQVNAPGTI